MSRFVSRMIACLSLLALARAAGAQDAAEVFIRRVELRGCVRTRADVLLELLPRKLPARLRRAELETFERYLNNLEIFDQVSVKVDAAVLTVSVREKWTLIPSLDFATGTRLADTYIALGATEYNLLGTAGQLGVVLEHQQRGLGFYLTFKEHEYRLRRWAFGAEAAHGLSETAFDGAGAEQSWITRRTAIAAWLVSPPLAHDTLRLQVGATFLHEANEAQSGSYAPASGSGVVGYLQLAWDAYQFHDLTPQGARIQLDAGPGLFMPAAEPRHYAQLTALTAVPLGASSVWLTRTRVTLDSRGNANYAQIIGSLEGVRGLPDNVYHAWWSAFTNSELRASVSLLERLAVQGVVFVDAAHFATLRFDGGRGADMLAISSGIGLRLIPTFLAQLLLRFDVARLWLPERHWFYQLGVSQYF